MMRASAPVLSLPELAPLQRVRLWLSYQRYGLLLCGSAVLPVAVALLWPRLFWVWAPLALLALPAVRFGVTVLGRWPRKLRATLVAEHRMRRGRFRPESVLAYCGDPCFRLVAHEILARAGMPASERRALVARLRVEHEKRSRVLLLVDHATCTVFTVQDGRVSSRSGVSGPGVSEASCSGMGDSALIRPAPSASRDAALSS